MPPKENLERACEECIHFFACSRQCGEPMAQSSATGCECYETIKSSMAYYVGTLDGAKGKIPNRLRELAEADKDGRCVVLPCKPGDTVYSIFGAEVIEKTVGRVIINGYTTPRIWVDLDCSFLSSVTKRWDLGIGKDFFLTREEAKKVLEERKGKKDG